MFRRRLIDPEIVDWHFEGFEWLIDHFSSAPELPDGELWEPVDHHFPTGEDELAERLFVTVLKQYGLFERQQFVLIPVEAAPTGSLGGVASVQSTGQTVCGTYQIVTFANGEVREHIHYRKDMGAMELVATFAHELAHAAHARVRDAEDIYDDLYELFTDLTAVYFGYGLFLCNTRFEVRGFSDGTVQGWEAKGAGYLPEPDLVFATALFMRLKNITIDVAQPHLKPRLYRLLKRAFRQLEREGDRIEALRRRPPVAS